jgi:hypothetical protein
LDLISTDHSGARRAPVPIAMPCLGSPSEARRGEQVHTCFYLSPLLHSFLVHYLSRHPSTSTCNVGLKSCHPPYMNVSVLYRPGTKDYHASCSFGSYLPARRASTLPRIPRLWIPPPHQEGLWCCHASRGTGPTSLLRRAPTLPHVL